MLAKSSVNDLFVFALRRYISLEVLLLSQSNIKRSKSNLLNILCGILNSVQIEELCLSKDVDIVASERLMSLILLIFLLIH